jgi:hypothetical protein
VRRRRWPLGTSYTAIVEDVKTLIARRPLDLPLLGVDGTGVGMSVVDMVAAGGIEAQLVPVLITAGHRTT